MIRLPRLFFRSHRCFASGLGALGVAIALASLAVGSAASRSTWDGVFSPAQVERGRKAYYADCARCHGETLGGGETSPGLVDAIFFKKWDGKKVGELVEYTRERMPSDGPGKISRRRCTDVVAFMLSENGFPAGESDLAPELESLNQIQITKKK